MLRKQPKYCQLFADRHGKPRCYLRRPGFPSVPLPGLPWTPEFMAAYEAAVSGDTIPTPIGKHRVKPGTIEALIVSYYQSPEYLNLKPITRRTYGNVLERFCSAHGHRTVAGLERDHIERIMAKMADRPAAANRLRKMIKILMRHAVAKKMRKDDPTSGVRKLNDRSTGFRAWTESEIQQFEATHPLGSRARLAFDLLLYTAQRRADVVTMGRQHVSVGYMKIRQSKTGTEVTIPIHPDLAETLATVTDNMTFVLTQTGKPFTPAGFTNWFRDLVEKAGLPAGLAPHGLCKAACRRLAETESSAPMIMPISGHKNLAEVQTYIESANRKKLAAAGMARIERRTKIVKPADVV